MILGIFDIVGILNTLKNALVDVYSFVILILDFVPTLISFFPNPFRSITLAFVSVMIAMYSWKLFNGGGS